MHNYVFLTSLLIIKQWL